MQKKAVFRILLFIFIAILFAGLCVFTFVDFRSFKKVYYSVNYETTVGGKIVGSVKQSVQKGKDAETVTAVPDEGYRFLRWADTSSPNPERTDTNIVKDIKPQAKFVKISDIKYKILLVHVTEVQGTFKDIDGNDVVIDYKMTEEDLAACRMITELLDVCMNEMFDGLVTFEIDEYYTKDIVGEDSFKYTVFENFVDIALYPPAIPEVAEKLSDYNTAITTVSINDPDRALRGATAGVTDVNSKTAMVYLKIPQVIMPNGETVNDYSLINDYSDYEWVNAIYPYVHEFVHTVEERITMPWRHKYHYILDDYDKTYIGYDSNLYAYTVSKLYLLNQAEYNGNKVGIPFPVWTNDIYEVHYNVYDRLMGTIGSWSSPLKVAKGCDGVEMEAISWPGYRFVRWSDGVTTAKRIDRNIQSDMEVIAYFEPNEYTITYLATEGGHIEGKTNQVTYGNNPFETVTAVAEEGYRFVGWDDYSEGSSEFNTRTDRIHVGNLELFESHNRSIVVTAIFEKVN